MANRLVHVLILSAGVLAIGGCASQTATRQSLDDRYFEKEVRHMTKYQHEGQVVYCQTEDRTASLIPFTWCKTEAALRQRVENARLDRNKVMPAQIG
jgi:outer membrane biogenesis lipoprotein LolB